MKILGRGEILGSGEKFGSGQKFWVRVTILGSGENFGWGRKFLVWVKILGLGENFGSGQKFLVQVSHWFTWVQSTKYKSQFKILHQKIRKKSEFLAANSNCNLVWCEI